MTQQGDRQASVRVVTGTTGTYDGDWSALFDAASIPTGDYNGRLLAWLNLKLSQVFGDLGQGLQALADSAGAFNFSSLGAFDASTAVGGPFLLLESGSFTLLEDGSSKLALG